MGVRVSSGLITIQNSLVDNTLFTLSTSKTERAVIRKIAWINRTGANTFLRIGHTTLGGVFTQDLPDILMLAGIDGQWTEPELPICGNTPEGFAPNTTLVTGTLGNIIGRAVASAATPNDVQVNIEMELFA